MGCLAYKHQQSSSLSVKIMWSDDSNVCQSHFSVSSFISVFLPSFLPSFLSFFLSSISASSFIFSISSRQLSLSTLPRVQQRFRLIFEFKLRNFANLNTAFLDDSG